jgi:hypothetical protein
MARRAKRALCGLGIVVVLLLMALALSTQVMWVGNTDLMVEFVVTDARSGAPIHGAELTGLDCESLERFAVRTDERGVAHVSSRCMTSGRSSRLTPWRNTFAVDLPLRAVRTHAPGYRATEEKHLGELCDARTVERTAPGRSRLVVQIALEPLP